MNVRKQNLNPVWKKLKKLVDMGELNTTPHRAHFYTRKHFLPRGSSFTARIFFVSFPKQSCAHVQIMFHAQSSVQDYPPLPRPHGTPSLLFPSHGDDIHCDPGLHGQSRRLAEHTIPAEIITDLTWCRFVVFELI